MGVSAHAEPMDDKSFYAAVYNTPTLTRVLEQHQLTSHEFAQQRSGLVFKLSKDPWLIHLGDRTDKGVHIHFECAGRNFHLHIETFPYTPKLAEKPEEQARLQPEIELRKDLHRAIRLALKGLRSIRVDEPRFASDDLKANSTGRFVSDLSDNSTPEQYAGFMARIIEAVVPIVDGCIADVMKTPAH
jgi:hypothetical protein